MDLSIVIRSDRLPGRVGTFGVGGAVVADSDPDAEYEETLDKARALIAAIENAGRRRCGMSANAVPKVVILDNYDSFTFNLFQMRGRTVRRQSSRWSSATTRSPSTQLRALEPDRIIISPGPGSPDKPEYFGVCRAGDPGAGPNGCRSWACAWAIWASSTPSAARSCAPPSRATARPA